MDWSLSERTSGSWGYLARRIRSPRRARCGLPAPSPGISSNRLNRAGAVAVVVPVTSRERHVPTHVRVSARQGTGLRNESWAAVDDVKSVSMERLEEHLG